MIERAPRNTTGIRHAARVTKVFVRVAVQQELHYRANYWSALAATLGSLALSLAAVSIVYGYTDELNGWSSAEVMLVVGNFFIAVGLITGIVHMSLAAFTTRIRTGTLDYQLLRPVDAQIPTIVQSVGVFRFIDVLVGPLLIAWAINDLGGVNAVGLDNIALMLAMLAAGMLALAGLWMIIAYLVFWATDLQGVLYALDELMDSARWPLAVYPGWLRVILTFVFPIGLAVTVPASAARGTLDAMAIAGTWTIALALIVIARVVWTIGVRRYEGASS